MALAIRVLDRLEQKGAVQRQGAPAGAGCRLVPAVATHSIVYYCILYDIMVDDILIVDSMF